MTTIINAGYNGNFTYVGPLASSVSNPRLSRYD